MKHDRSYDVQHVIKHDYERKYSHIMKHCRHRRLYYDNDFVTIKLNRSRVCDVSSRFSKKSIKMKDYPFTQKRCKVTLLKSHTLKILRTFQSLIMDKTI